jgi:hypothetical protein
MISSPRNSNLLDVAEVIPGQAEEPCETQPSAVHLNCQSCVFGDLVLSSVGLTVDNHVSGALHGYYYYYDYDYCYDHD